MLKNGSILNDRYEIIGVVGSGGMSDVYKAKCHKLNRYVAIKVLKKEYSMDKSFVSKFRGEAQSAAGLSNPNIVNIYDVCEDNDLYYIVMELVEGITLKAYIEKKGRLDVKESVSIAIQIAQGIKAAHAHHIIHRDIKPQNIIISKDGKVKVTDFGIARVSSTQTINSNAMGSVHYISPEQARGGYVDERSDIYSLGITLYEMLTGQVPFQNDTSVSVALMHIQNEMPSPRNIVPSIPVDVENIIYKCTQKKVDKRYADAETLIEDLKASLLGIGQDKSSTIVKKTNPTTKSNDNNITDHTTPIPTRKVSAAATAAKTHRKDFLEKFSSDDKKKNPIIERALTIVVVLIAIAIIVLGVYSVMLIKETLTPPDIIIPTIDTTTTPTNSQLGISDVEMPDLRNYTQNDAIIELNKINLKNKITNAYSSTVAKGLVISQQYKEGTLLERNTVVQLVISLGPVQYEIIDYTGKTYEEVEAILTEHELICSPVFIYDSEVPIGGIIKTEPEIGEILSSGASVKVYISRGREFDLVQVPSITGITVEEADARLSLRGLTFGNISYEHNESVAEGIILTQSLLTDSSVLPGTEVDITVSLGKSTPTTSITLEKSQFTRFISEENNAFRRPIGPGSSSTTIYQYGVLTLELTQINLIGEEVTTPIRTMDITLDQLPLYIDKIEGLKDVSDGTIKVYLTLDGTRYTIGSFYVEFQ